MIYQIHQQDAELRGEARGISIGEERKAVDTAKSMMRENLPNDMISRVTGLPIAQIQKIRGNLPAN